jgi:membrane-associated phospholipid phosphatase
MECRLMKSWNIGVLIALAVAAHAVAARAAETDLNSEYLKGIVSDAGDIMTRPLSMGARGWLKFIVVAGLTATLADEEEDIQAWVQEHRTPGTQRISGIARCFGNGIYSVPALGALCIAGGLAGSDRARRTALLGLESLAITGAFTETIKQTTHKRRPVSGAGDEIPWYGPGFMRRNRSFPSGHSGAAFAVATVVASEYGSYAAVRPLVYGAATLCALSRVHDDAHWLSDVIVGSIIGHLTARAVIRLNGGGSRADPGLAPFIRDGAVGVSMSYRF